MMELHRGQIPSTPYIDVLELKSIFEKGDFQVLSKTTSSMIIKLTIIKLEMISDQSQQIEELNANIKQLQETLSKQNACDHEDLDAKIILISNVSKNYKLISIQSCNFICEWIQFILFIQWEGLYCCYQQEGIHFWSCQFQNSKEEIMIQISHIHQAYINIILIMHTDQKYQEKSYKYCAKVQSGKLILEINDGATYHGQIEASPYLDILELKSIFERGEIQILTKTSSKMLIKFAVFKLQMQSEESHQIQSLKARIQQLQNKLKLDQGWKEEDLDSKANFDIDCIYKITFSSGYRMTSVSVGASTIYFSHNGTSYSTSSSNRRATTVGWTVSRIQRQKI